MWITMVYKEILVEMTNLIWQIVLKLIILKYFFLFPKMHWENHKELIVLYHFVKLILASTSRFGKRELNYFYLYIF